MLFFKSVMRLALVFMVSISFFFAGMVPAMARTGDETNNIDIYKRVSPGVVNILSVVITRDFFLNAIPEEGAGSGVIVDNRGYILTNNHVIENAHRLEVTLYNGDKLPAKLVGADPDSDLAVIKIDPVGRNLTPVPLADSESLQVGQKVLAIGNPFGLGETLTTGIISSLGRTIKAQNGMEIEGVIQTDASINPGNSGGPLLNSEGEIIGINSAIFSPTGSNVGIGFAIPVDIATKVLPDLISKGYVAYPWMGASLFPVIPGIAEVLDLKVKRGVMIVDMARGGPSDAAGLRGASRQLQAGNLLIPIGGDIIVTFDGTEITSTDQLLQVIRNHRPGDRVKIKILRDDQFRIIPLTLGERPRLR